jgi:hypothetical protein
MPDHDQGDTLSRPERQRSFRLEKTFFVMGFDKPH